ncbi:Uncharacterized protein pbN1_26380 [Aromatoleum bremense]|nr:Uncharacterized protein pbN1_26380 [Aromatoleum bremense]
MTYLLSARRNLQCHHSKRSVTVRKHFDVFFIMQVPFL